LPALLVVAGFTASRDPLDNPLPLVVWTLWWVGFTFWVAIVGNLWAILNPWRALYGLVALAHSCCPSRLSRCARLLAAVVLLLHSVGFELVDPAPQDPQSSRLRDPRYAVTLQVAGMLVYGEEPWLERGEAFSVFFRIVGWAVAVRRSARRASSSWGLPCRALIDAGRIPPAPFAFILVALASVSFDGLSRTFWWIGLVGENPLEHRAAAALMRVNTLGLLATAAALGVRLRRGRPARKRARLGTAATQGRSMATTSSRSCRSRSAYHFAHYLPTFLVDAQYAMRALADPFRSTGICSAAAASK
jgi:hypothetical protein